MKKIFLAAAALAVLGAPMAASASEINLAGVLTVAENVRTGETNQAAQAATIAVGNVAGSDVSASATSLVNTAVNSVDATMTANLGNGLLIGTLALNDSLGPVNQYSGALAGSGGLSNGSSSAAAALNSVNLGQNTVTIVTK